jgi:hypothetical protein
MIILDANVLLYAYDSGSLYYAKAKEWLEQILSSDDLVGLPWQTIGAFTARRPGL